MSWKVITYSCGHDDRVCLSGNASSRDKYAAWCRENRVCTACWENSQVEGVKAAANLKRTQHPRAYPVPVGDRLRLPMIEHDVMQAVSAGMDGMAEQIEPLRDAVAATLSTRPQAARRDRIGPAPLADATNRHGNIDLRDGLPKELSYVPGERLQPLCRRLEIPFREALVGFDQPDHRYPPRPLRAGVVVHARDRRRLLLAIAARRRRSRRPPSCDPSVREPSSGGASARVL